jgi:zinc protease
MPLIHADRPRVQARSGALAIGWLVALLAGAAQMPAVAFDGRAASAMPADAAPVLVRSLEDIGEYRLPNGLQILLVPDPSRPVVAVHLTVRAGAAQDPAGASGAMHVLEHLMFRPRAGQGPAHAAIAQRGIRANANTSYDRTTFFASFASDADVERWYLGWLADAFADGRIEPGQVEGEFGAIRNEMQAAQGSALGQALDAALWTLYGGEHYGRPPIGWQAEIESLGMATLEALRAAHYRPDNATLIVAGAIDPEATLRTIAQGFGALPKPAARTDVPAPAAGPAVMARSLVLARPGTGPIVVAAAPGPDARDADSAAARLLAYAITREPAGLLNQRLVDAGIAARVMGQARTLAHGGTLLFAAQPAAGKEPAVVAESLREALAGAGALTPAQFEQARHGWMAEWRRRFNDPERLAEDLSDAVGRGDWRLHLADYAAVAALAHDDLRRVASERLSTPLVVTLLPVAPTPVADAPRRTLAIPDQPGAATAARRKPSPAAASVRRPTDMRPATRTLADGRLSLSVARQPQRGGAVLARLAIPILAAASTQEQTRAAGLLASMLGTFAATPGGASAFQYELDRIETGLSVGFFRQEILIDIHTRADRFDAAMARVRALLEADGFEQAMLDAEKRKWRGRLDQAARDPVMRLGELQARHGNPHAQGDVRYAPTIEEDIDSLQRVGLADIARTRAALIPLRGARMAIVGDLDPATAAAAMTRHFQPLMAADGLAAPVLVDDVRQAPAPATLVWRGRGGENVALTWTAFLPLKEGDRDALALALANRMFGQPGSGRLWRRLREREGLSYGAWSEFDWSATAPSSWWRASVSAGARDLRRVEQVLAEEFDAVRREGFAADELAQAKAGYLQEQRRFASQPERLMRRQLDALRTGMAPQGDIASLERQVGGLGLDDVNAAWRRYIEAGRMVRAMAGNVPEDAASGGAAH